MTKAIASVLAAAQLLLAIYVPSAFAAGGRTDFTDVKHDDWFYGPVTDVAAEGILFGYGDGTFRPYNPTSRGEFISIVARLAGLNSTGQVDHWAANRMQAALEHGLYDYDEAPPTAASYDAPITRQLAVKVVMKAFLPDARGDYNYVSKKMTDFSSLDGRYYEWVFAAYATGVIVGDVGGAFRPKDSLSRAETCVIVRKVLRLMRTGSALPPGTETPGPQPSVTRKGGVTENGRLQVKGTQLCNEKGDPIVLHGMSTHGLQWYGQFCSEGAVKTTADHGANLLRLAMYTAENGYISNPTTMENWVTDGVAAAVKNDMYVIIDWHILSDGNPNTYKTQALAFFRKMAKKYKDTPSVIFEICNEPNGNVSWSGEVKPYAQDVVNAIRAEGADNVILIGSPTWSQDVHLAAADPVTGSNLMYTLHFYAGTHGQDLRSRAENAMKSGLPLFVSEWGTSRADGSGGVYLREAGEWLDFLDRYGVSWANWSLCDKGETSAALKPGASSGGGWKDSDLSESGKFVFSRF